MKKIDSKIRKLSEITVGVVFFVTGMIAALFGAGIFGDIVPTVFCFIFFAFFTSLFTVALVQKNPLILWLSVLFLPLLVIEVAASLGAERFLLYPLYIFAPAAASFAAAVFPRRRKMHLTFAAFLSSVTAATFLHSTGVLSFGIVFPIIIIIIGAALLVVGFKEKK